MVTFSEKALGIAIQAIHPKMLPVLGLLLFRASCVTKTGDHERTHRSATGTQILWLMEVELNHVQTCGPEVKLAHPEVYLLKK